jgi:hypothetical protein
MKRVLACVGLTMCVTVFLAAQTQAQTPPAAQTPPPPPVLRGNPTPGTPQPEMPKPADRIALTGCVARAEGAAAKFDSNTPSDTRYLLTGAKREKRVPAGTGTSPATAAVTGDRFRLAGIDSVLSPFVGARVEVSGQVETPSAEAAKGTANLLVLRVEFVKKLAPACS